MTSLREIWNVLKTESPRQLRLRRGQSGNLWKYGSFNRPWSPVRARRHTAATTGPKVHASIFAGCALNCNFCAARKSLRPRKCRPSQRKNSIQSFWFLHRSIRSIGGEWFRIFRSERGVSSSRPRSLALAASNRSRMTRMVSTGRGAYHHENRAGCALTRKCAPQTLRRDRTCGFVYYGGARKAGT